MSRLDSREFQIERNLVRKYLMSSLWTELERFALKKRYLEQKTWDDIAKEAGEPSWGNGEPYSKHWARSIVSRSLDKAYKEEYMGKRGLGWLKNSTLR